MLTNNLIYLLPIASVVVFSLMEKFLFNQQGVSKKTQPIALITLMNLIVSLGFSAVILIPFIMLVAPLQMFSFAQQDIPGFVKVTLSLIAIDFIYYISHRYTMLYLCYGDCTDFTTATHLSMHKLHCYTTHWN